MGLLLRRYFFIDRFDHRSDVKSSIDLGPNNFLDWSTILGVPRPKRSSRSEINVINKHTTKQVEPNSKNYATHSKDEDLLCINGHPLEDPIVLKCANMVCRVCVNIDLCPCCNERGCEASTDQILAPMLKRLDSLIVECDLCNCKMERQKFNDHPDCRIDCPLCKEKFAPNAEVRHRQECLGVEVQCPGKKFLCPWKGRRRQLEEHEKICKHLQTSSPIEQVMKKISRLERLDQYRRRELWLHKLELEKERTLRELLEERVSALENELRQRCYAMESNMTEMFEQHTTTLVQLDQVVTGLAERVQQQEASIIAGETLPESAGRFRLYVDNIWKIVQGLIERQNRICIVPSCKGIEGHFNIRQGHHYWNVAPIHCHCGYVFKTEEFCRNCRIFKNNVVCPGAGCGLVHGKSTEDCRHVHMFI
ncbi:hypothetical protein PROFUN_01045 [Planoprotostelium fungivorum]|uniref:TRAF-type domain-containing protein n=1 Tax=Planoprotostelium fungivorum TaxID=1890364 RepID=A0A2P6N4K6_9EUKA|nr:hypothetical protein PROFUN_01045 [Planoprotostelium fungivorum]